MFNANVKDSTVSDLKNAVNEANCDLHNAANQAGRKVRGMYNTASDEITQASDKVTGEIRSNPVRSSVIALGMGVLLGALLRKQFLSLREAKGDVAIQSIFIDRWIASPLARNGVL